MKRSLFILGGLMASVMTSSPASAGDTCAYVMGNVSGRTFTTPAIPVVVPDSSITVGAADILVDPTSQTILGYVQEVPGLEGATDTHEIFLAGINKEIPSYSHTLSDMGLSSSTCISAGATTPAVPIYIPASQLSVPGFATNTPYISMNLVGKTVTLPGQYLSFPGYTVVIPSYSNVIPSQTVQTPDRTISVSMSAGWQTASYLVPPTP